MMDNTAIMLAFHIIVCILYSGFWYRKNKEEGICRFIVVLFIPLAGLIYFIILDILCLRGAGSKHKPDMLYDFDNEVVSQSYEKVDFEKEVNVIPIEEALAVNSASVKRNILINACKDDAEKYIEYLKKALKDKDMETSRFAAVTIMEVKQKLAASLQELAVKYEENKEDLAIARLYADILKRYINSGFLDKRSTIKYKYIYLSVLENILGIDDSEEIYFIEKINCHIELGEYHKAYECCKKFSKRHPGNEMPYLMSLKIFYILRDYRRFNKFLELFKDLDIKISSKALNIIRFWLGVGN